MTQSDRWKSRPCTARYWAFKDELRLLWRDRPVPDTFWVVFTIPMPSSWSAKKKALLDGKPHQTKPDADNLGKAFADCLLDDDSRLWDVRFTKRWGEAGSIEIRELV
jgi:Holliday junction resolvase RusA-like endonuclease